MQIQVRNGNRGIPNAYKEIPDGKITFVGGKEGIFAFWMENEIVCMAAGDGDGGSWWQIAQYDKRWVPQIIEALNVVTGK